jgi:hypothetical protein
MKCFFCDTEVRWNNDFDLEDVNPDSEYTITSMYECDNCKAWYEVSTDKKESKCLKMLKELSILKNKISF